jgi:hypothetical protein
MLSRSIACLGTVLVALTLAACGAEDSGASDSSPETANDEIVAKVLANAARVYPDRLEFPRASFSADLRGRVDRYNAARKDGKGKGDVENVILVGDRGADATGADGEINPKAANPYGYIRRALSWRDEGDTTIVMTEVASLDEAFAEFSANGMVEIGKPGAPTTQNLGVSRQALSKKMHFDVPIVNLANKQLYQIRETQLSIKQGSVTLKADVDFGVDIGFFKLNEAHVIVDGAIDSEIVLQLAGKDAIDQVIEKELFHKTYKLAGVGPISLSVDVNAKAVCDVDAAGTFNVSGGLDIDAQGFQGGVTYKKGEGVKPTFRPPTLTPPRVIKPTFNVDARANVTCHVRPILQVMIFDQPGPAVTPDLMAKLEASTPPVKGTLTGGLSASVNGKLNILGKELGSFDKELFSVERELFTYPTN